MAQIVNLIPASFLRDRTDIGVNYNESNVSNAVEQAQEFELVDLIGRNLYVTLQNHVVAFANDATPIPPTYKSLLDNYIASYLVWVSYYNLLESIYLKPSSVGIGQRSFPGGTAISGVQYEKKRVNIRPKIDHFGTRLTQFLNDQGGQVFVELDDSEDLATDRRKPATSTSSPILTSRRRKFGPNIR